MDNAFYSDFDFETFGERPDDYRTPFQRDRDRIIHTSAFRRLQAKTQVFLAGEYDFYRTRLTHSIEVAQIGRSICTYLQQHSELLNDSYYIDSDLVEVVCLSHDLGHPPFGHAGETSLNKLLRDFGGFEGNAQTLRIICDTVYSSGGPRHGLSPSRAYMDGVMKYKTRYAQLENPDNHFIYDSQLEHLDFVFGGETIPEALTPGKVLNSFRSIECQIMDWADDTAYSTNDLVDGINAGFITMERIERWAERQSLSRERAGDVAAILDAIRGQRVESFFGRKIAQFVKAVQLVERETFMSPHTRRYGVALQIDEEIADECGIYKQLAVDLVFRSPQISQLEHKGDHMLCRIFEVLRDAYVENEPGKSVLLPDYLEKLMREGGHNRASKARLLGDYVSGMTDGHALRTYRRMFEPQYGSIVDLVQ